MGVLRKIGQNSFHVRNNKNSKREYFYAYSKEMQDIVDMIKEEYPLVDFQVWEFVQLNEFVIHQIGKNVCNYSGPAFVKCQNIHFG